MLRSLTSGISGLQEFQRKMDVIGNNIANSNTTAFKSARVDFADSFSQTLRGSTGANGSASSTPAIQIGTGVVTAGIKNLYSQGPLIRTGQQTDLGISGEGFFMVRDPVTDVQFATRSGDFRVDSNGYLVTNTGLRVQGFSDSGLSARGDILIDDTSRPATIDPTANFVAFSIGGEGQIAIKLDYGSEFVRGQILLQRFNDPHALEKQGLNLYSGIGAAGPLGGSATPQAEAPATNGLGRIESGALELSNVDLANEFANMITTQRGFQASARIITTSDEMLQELVNLKR
jgi:flagellar hook protein FlgE